MVVVVASLMAFKEGFAYAVFEVLFLACVPIYWLGLGVCFL